MIRSLRISGFKCFRQLDLPELGSINLFVGKNNTGKSSILEAVELFASESVLAIYKSSYRRNGGIPYDVPRELALIRMADSLRSFFHKGKNQPPGIHIRMESDEPESKLEIEASPFVDKNLSYLRETIQSAGGQSNPFPPDLVSSLLKAPYTLSRGAKDPKSFALPIGVEVIQMTTTDGTLGLPHPQSQPVAFLSARGSYIQEARQRWDRLSFEGIDEVVLDWMRLIEPELREIRFLRDEWDPQERPYLRVNGDPGFKPLSYFGDGLTRVFHLALAVASSGKGIVLIDEFENGLHWSIQKELWRAIQKAAEQFQVQVFATTHSQDCLRALASMHSGELFKSSAYVYRLERENADVIARNLRLDALQSALDLAVEVR